MSTLPSQPPRTREVGALHPDLATHDEVSRSWVARRYRRLALLGRGATGMVHRAQDRLNGRLVALKSVATNDLTTPQDSSLTSHSRSVVRRTELIEREFLLLAKLRHPNVVATLDDGFDASGRPFFSGRVTTSRPQNA